MDFMFHGAEDGNTIIQTSEDGSRSIRSDDRAFDIAYRQVWLCALRVSGGSPGHSKRPAVLRAWDHPHAQYRLSQLAHQVGFRSDRIALSIASDTQPESPLWDAFEVEKEPALKRCGIPYVVTFKTDREVLFLDRVGADLGECGKLPSSFILCDIYHSFFGLLQDIQVDEQQASDPNAAPGDAFGEPVHSHNGPASADTSNPGHETPAAHTEPPSESRPMSPDAHRDSSTTASSTPAAATENPGHETPAAHTEPLSESRPMSPDAHRDSSTTARSTPAAATEMPAATPTQTSGGNPSATSIPRDEPATSAPNPAPPVNLGDRDHRTERSTELEEIQKTLQALHNDLQHDLRCTDGGDASLGEIREACKYFAWPDASDAMDMEQDVIDNIEKIRKSSAAFESKIDETKNKLKDLRSHVINTDRKVQEQVNRIGLCEQGSTEIDNTSNALQEAEKVYNEACHERQAGLRRWSLLEQAFRGLWCELGNLQILLHVMCIGGLLNASLLYSEKVGQLCTWENYLYEKFGDSDEGHCLRLSALDQASGCLAGLLASLQQTLKEVQDLKTEVPSHLMGRDMVLHCSTRLKDFRHESQKTFVRWKLTVDDTNRGIMDKYGPVALSHGRELVGATNFTTRSCEDIASKLANLRSLHTSMLNMLNSEQSFSSFLDHEARESIFHVPEKIGSWDSAHNWIQQRQAACIDDEGQVKTFSSRLEQPADLDALTAACKEGARLDAHVKKCSLELQEFNTTLEGHFHGLIERLLMLASGLNLKAQEASKQVMNGSQHNNIHDLQEAIKMAKSAEADSKDCVSLAESVQAVAQKGNISDDACSSIKVQVRGVGEAQISISGTVSDLQNTLSQKLVESVEPFLTNMKLKSAAVQQMATKVNTMNNMTLAKCAVGIVVSVENATESIYRSADNFAMHIPNNALFVPHEFLVTVDTTKKGVAQTTSIAFGLYTSIASSLKTTIKEKATWIQQIQKDAQEFAKHGQRQQCGDAIKGAELAMKEIVGYLASLEQSMNCANKQQSKVETCKLDGWATEQGQQVCSQINHIIASAVKKKDGAEMIVKDLHRTLDSVSEPTGGSEISPFADGVRAEAFTANPTNSSPEVLQDVPMQTDKIAWQGFISSAKSLVSEINKEEIKYANAWRVSDFHTVEGTIPAIKSCANEADGTGQALHALRLSPGGASAEEAIQDCSQVMLASIALLGQIVKDVKKNSFAACGTLVTERDTARNAARAEEKEKYGNCVEKCHQMTESIHRTEKIAEAARSAAEEIRARFGHTTWLQELPRHAINTIQEQDIQGLRSNVAKANGINMEAKIAWWMEAASRNQRRAENEWDVAERKFKLTNPDPSLKEWSLAEVAYKLASEAYEQATSRLSACEGTESDFEVRAQLFDKAYFRAQAADKAAETAIEKQATGRHHKRKLQEVEEPEESADVLRRGRTKHIRVFKIQREGEWESESHTVKQGESFQKGKELTRRGVLYCLNTERTKLGNITADTFETLAINGETIFFLLEDSMEIGPGASSVELKDRAVAYYNAALNASRG
ncbi:uncharacterized protein LDX57_013023 [Aspergillus melleus]|uniref:uncharacterized protein n=1 Tax=Aspergillus melleus TaxID=138277 RepID=UPI001E8E35CD|nr:uncharacterized protein LDX57_013023 [Aspergillus melleus]KAH8435393.1 hypothetical protein LDX57_013023 [Aspergillus melleus]